MVIYLYRWKLKAGMERQFLDAWSYVTKELRAKCGSLGSRLHSGSDGLYYGYAQWPDRRTCENADLSDPQIDEARKRMPEATEGTLPETILEANADFLIGSGTPEGQKESSGMVNHLSVGISNLQRSIAFYDAVLAALGYVRLWTGKDAADYGYPEAKDEPFAIKLEDTPTGLGSSARSHIAFTATTREQVNAFYDAAISSGAGDLGKPGLRPHYGENYYAAFVQDPDGYRLEGVCHAALEDSGGTE